MEVLKTENETLKEEVKNLKAQKETYKTENGKLKKEKEEFQAVATETKKKFKALQEEFTGMGLDIDTPEGKGDLGGSKRKKFRS